MVAMGDQVVLLAGTAPDGGAPNLEMWLFDGGSWGKRDIALPGYRSEAVMVAY